jgi:hypothetical protein
MICHFFIFFPSDYRLSGDKLNCASARPAMIRLFFFLAGDAPVGPPVVVPIVKELSQMYTNIESSWGFEKVRALGFRLVYALGLGLV